MTDLDALKREAEMRLEQWRHSRKLFSYHVLPGDLIDLIQRLLPALEDARRYRELRTHEVSYSVEYEGNIGATVWISGEELDAAIDSAMEKADGK